MSGLLRRLRPDRAGTPEPAEGDTAPLPAGTEAPPAEDGDRPGAPARAEPGDGAPTGAPAAVEPEDGARAEAPAAVEPEDGARAEAPAAVEPGDGAPADAPAGVEPEDPANDRPDTRRRGRLRRRLRHLRQLRELMLRDVGGLAYELHRAPADDAARERGAAVIGERLERLATLDAERRGLEAALGDVRAQTVLREPGIGGTCPACGEYFASSAHFCANCGAPVDGRAAAAPEARQDAVPEESAPAEARTEVRT